MADGRPAGLPWIFLEFVSPDWYWSSTFRHNARVESTHGQLLRASFVCVRFRNETPTVNNITDEAHERENLHTEHGRMIYFWWC